MRYTLPKDAWEKLLTIRSDYERLKNVKLDSAPGYMTSKFTFVGATDIATRDTQTKFLSKFLTVYEKSLFLTENDIENPQLWNDYVEASQVMFAACTFIQSQIGFPKTNSVLYNLIDAALGINKTNFPDREDITICLESTSAKITFKSLDTTAFAQANLALRQANQFKVAPRFLYDEWDIFSNFLTKTIAECPPKQTSILPITRVTQSALGKVGLFAGTTVGILGGSVVSNSSHLLGPKMQLTAGVGSVMLMFSTGPTGVALIAPVFADYLLRTFSSVSAAYILGRTGEKLGELSGYSAVPLDLAFIILCKISSVIAEKLRIHPEISSITGVRLSTGALVFNGIDLQLTNTDRLPADCVLTTVNITKDSIDVDGKKSPIPKNGQLPLEVIEQLAERLQQISQSAALRQEALTQKADLDVASPDTSSVSSTDDVCQDVQSDDGYFSVSRGDPDTAVSSLSHSC